MLGVAVRCVGGGKDVRLLRPRGHSGRRAAALYVEDHRGNLGEISEAKKFLHQRDARTRRRRESPCTVPRRPNDHADRRKLVLRLYDGIAVLACYRVDTKLAAVLGKCFRQ